MKFYIWNKDGKQMDLYFQLTRAEGSRGVYRISSVPSLALSTFSNDISETAGPVETKLHAEPPWGWGTKVCSLCVDHMTKVAAMPIYGKNLCKSSSQEPNG